MRRVVWLLLIFAAAAGLALLMRFNHGNVAVLWPPYRVDFSVNLGVLLLLAGFFVLHLLLVAVYKMLALPSKVRSYRERRQQEQARNALRDSILALFEGRYGRAERLAESARKQPAFVGPASLLAARAAHRMRAFDRRDRWLEVAAEDRASVNAGLMTEAELALEAHDTARALSAIERLHGKGLRHIHSMRTALRVHEQAEDWQRVLSELRQLEKRDALPEAAVRGLRVRACRALLSARAGDAAGLKDLWSSFKPFEREVPEVVEAAAAAFDQAGQAEQARKLLEASLEREPTPALLALYAGLGSVSARERIQKAESWRQSHGDSSELFLALGRLCIAEGIWGKAEEYLNRSLSYQASRAAHVALAELGEAIGRPDLTAKHYREAARAAA